jgi:hypothetical protein
MYVLVAITVGLVFWIAGWAFGIGSFDAFMVAIALAVAAFAVRMLAPFVKQQLGRD